MELQSLKARTRQMGAKGLAGRMRKQGEIPAVLYGGGQDAVSVKVNEREFQRLVHGRGGEHAIVQLDVEDNPASSSPALLKDVQHHPVRGSVTHADFQRIRLDERITTLVPIRMVGQAKGVVEGGVLDFQLRELEVECLALEVPDEITVDVSELAMGDGIHVSQLTVPANVTIITDLERPVAAVHAPRMVRAETAEAAAEPVEGAEPAAPEVIGKGKTEEE